ncbi:cold-shock protein [Chryseolinea lacunae]|uniref:Cold shock domain-containing protein n=1 Tax=Chryseolinea lacunae TaxID=2801331 RepID=A0ABS1KMJ6_9BACT|nr:cold shock domain-containing protein [Chryseolinea lacunae]MBL0740472.1 cold shock domain-containing protein [Chryseolinea lacunae]
MARSQESFNKKELEKRRVQKRKEKEQRKEERKSEPKSDSSWENMVAYVDENGNITDTPPDPTRKKVINTLDIVTGSRNTGSVVSAKTRKGKVMFFNTSKGFGFIKDTETGESIFVPSKSLMNPIKDNDMVTFETEQGPKGLNAVKVKSLK